MLRNFLITSLRILWRNKVVSAINILSLSIGITAFILILLYVHHETSYDKFNENYDRIYRLEGDEYAKVPVNFGDYLRDKVPEVEHITQIEFESRPYNFIAIPDDDPQSSVAVQTELISADSNLFKVFTLPFVQGNSKSALSEPFAAVLTESTAKKLFGDRNPMGQVMYIDNLQRSDNQCHVTGIIKDPVKSHIEIDVLLSVDNLETEDHWAATYLLLNDNADPVKVNEKINTLLKEIKYDGMRVYDFKEFYIRPLSDLYLNGIASKEQYGVQGNGKLLWSFMAIALFVLVLAIINYINLTTARSTLRTKEVIIKKLMGSGRMLLQFQFVAETTIISLISFFLAITSVQLVIPKFNHLTQATINLAEYNLSFYWLLAFAAIILISLISGLYPAIVLTSFRSITKSQVRSANELHGANFRRALLTFQFSISIILIVSILINLQQLQFARNSDTGFNKEQILLLKAPGKFEEDFIYKESFKERILQHQAIEKVTFSSGRPIGEQSTGAKLEINGSVKYFKWKFIDPDFFDLMGVKVLEGRNFSWERISDGYKSANRFQSGQYAIIINETAARQYWSKSPVGKIYDSPFSHVNSNSAITAEIIGVVNDVHYRSIHHSVEPTIYLWRLDPISQVAIKISGTNIPNAIEIIEKEWKNVYGAEPFVYSFLDDQYNAQYASDERATTIIGYFTILAIIIACMGLFALSSFMAVRRTKEIGIRKALGASSKTIFVMLSREYIKWILLSAVIASPIAWYAMNKWLESFAYRIELGPGVFILAAVIALGIGLITVGWQALKSAVANPIEALRYE